MSKHIQAYFHTENEAEHVRTLMQTYEVDMLEVGKLDQGYQGAGRVIVPILGMDSDHLTGTGVAGNNTGIAPAAVLGTVDDDQDMDVDGHSNLHYVLSAKVLDEDYAEIRNLVRRNHGHVERLD